MVDDFERRLKAAEEKRDALVQNSAEQQAEAVKAREWFVSTWSERLRQFIDSALVETDKAENEASFGPRGSETHEAADKGRSEVFRYTRTGARLVLEARAAVTLRTSHNFVGASNAFTPDVPTQQHKHTAEQIQKFEQQSRNSQTFAAVYLTLKDRDVKDDPGVSDWLFYGLDHGRPTLNVEMFKWQQTIAHLVDAMGMRVRR